MEILKVKQKEMLKINTLTEMKTTFEGLINGLDTAEDRNSELEDMSVETWKTENLTGKRKKKTQYNI